MLAYFRERRKRQKKPFIIIIISLVIFSFPFFNYFSKAIRHNLAVYNVPEVIGSFNSAQYPFLGYMGIIFLFLPFVVVPGLLLIKRWGWWLFLTYAALLCVFNITVLIIRPSGYNYFATLQTVFLFSAIIYFTQKNISAPYMHLYPRGWRLQKRKLLEIPVTVNGTILKTKDIGDAGIFAVWPECDKEVGDELEVSFTLGGTDFKLTGAVVRKEADGAGIAFRYIDFSTQRDLRRHLKKISSPK